MNNMKSLFLLRDDVTFLNFGSFGACLSLSFEAYQAFNGRWNQAGSLYYQTRSTLSQGSWLLWVNILTAMQTMSRIICN
jgi:hypothetical protein